MEQIDVKKVLIQFGHWIALAVAVISIGITFLMSGDESAQTTKEEIKQKLEELKEVQRTNRPQKVELPNYQEKIISNWAPITTANIVFLRPKNIKDSVNFVRKLRDAKESDPISFYIKSNLTPETQQQLKEFQDEEKVSDSLLNNLIRDINAFFVKPKFFDKDRFKNVKLREETELLIYQNPQSDELIRLNRYLLDDAYPEEIYPYRRIGQDFFYEKGKIEYNKAQPPSQQWVNVPSNLALQVDREKISVSWEVPETPIDPATGKENKLSEITGYQLYKRWKNIDGKSEEKIIDLLGITNTAYEDTTVESKIDYYYKVRSYTENEEAQGGKPDTIDGKKVIASEYTTEQKGTILPSYRIRLTGILGDSALIELLKWEKGDWRMTSLRLKKGQKIEKKEWNKDLQKLIDFSPGWVLTKINPKAVQERESQMKKMVINPVSKLPEYGVDGKPLYKIETIRTKYTTAAVHYTNEKGQEEIRYQENKSDKKKEGDE